MRVIKYERADHLAAICKLLEKRGLNITLSLDLPKIGVLVTNHDLILAAGFIRRCEGDTGIFDSFITDPEAAAADRNLALDLITTELIEIAREQHLTSLIAYSIDKNTLVRSLRHGFEHSPYTVITKNLTSGQGV